jgi:hypothetical protein
MQLQAFGLVIAGAWVAETDFDRFGEQAVAQAVEQQATEYDDTAHGGFLLGAGVSLSKRCEACWVCSFQVGRVALKSGRRAFATVAEVFLATILAE